MTAYSLLQAGGNSCFDGVWLADAANLIVESLASFFFNHHHRRFDLTCG